MQCNAMTMWKASSKSANVNWPNDEQLRLHHERLPVSRRDRVH